jgi:hypothetical protein
MDYRSPTIHSLILTLAGSPIPLLLAVDTHILTGVKHGHDDARHNNRHPRFADRWTTRPIFHKAKINAAKKGCHRGSSHNRNKKGGRQSNSRQRHFVRNDGRLYFVIW